LQLDIERVISVHSLGCFFLWKWWLQSMKTEWNGVTIVRVFAIVLWCCSKLSIYWKVSQWILTCPFICRGFRMITAMNSMNLLTCSNSKMFEADEENNLPNFDAIIRSYSPEILTFPLIEPKHWSNCTNFRMFVI